MVDQISKHWDGEFKLRRVAPGGGEGTQKRFFYGEAPPRGPTPDPFISHFFRKGTPFVYLLLEKGTPFSIPSLDDL